MELKNNQSPILIVAGPTATKKTETAIEVASFLLENLGIQSEIINCDSLLFYKELHIGTARPTIEEQANIKHHLIGITSALTPLNAADYQKLALPIIDRLISQNILPILVGGSGFYLQTITNGMFNSPTTDPVILKKSNQLYEDEGISPFLLALEEFDPKSYKKIHANDHYRIRRAVEHFWCHKTPFSDAKRQHENLSKLPHLKFVHIYLDIPKDQHWEIIQTRTKKMFKAGLIDEVQGLLNLSPRYQYARPLQSVGYKEVLTFLTKNEFENLDSCQERVSISTRQLAKAQRTWFNKIENKKEYNPLLEKTNLLKDLHLLYSTIGKI